MKCLAFAEGADDWVPIAPVGIDRPNSPHPLIAQALTFITAEDHPAILERRGMEGAADIHGRDKSDVLAIVIHDEELKCRRGIAFGRNMAVAIAGKSQF